MNKKTKLQKEHPLCDVCDYCAYFNYNGIDMMREGKLLKGVLYISEGYCMHPKMRKLRCDPGDPTCKYFVCELCNPKLAKKIRNKK